QWANRLHPHSSMGGIVDTAGRGVLVLTNSTISGNNARTIRLNSHGGGGGGSTTVTTTTTVDGVMTEYPQEMLYSSANTLMSQVVHNVPSANYFSALDSFGSIERRRLVQPVMTGVPAPQSGTGTTLNDLAGLFRQDKPIYVLAELDATTFQKEPAE